MASSENTHSSIMASSENTHSSIVPSVPPVNSIVEPPTAKDRMAIMNNKTIMGSESTKELCTCWMELEVRQQGFINSRFEIVEDAMRAGSKKISNLESQVDTLTACCAEAKNQLRENNNQLCENTKYLSEIRQEQEARKKEEEKEKNDVYRYVQESEWSKRIMGPLPYLFDGMYGVCAWCPSLAQGTVYIVMSKAVTGDMVSAETGADGGAVADFLSTNLKLHDTFNAKDVGLLIEIMLNTPFKMVSKTRKSDKTWMKQMTDRYLIVSPAYMRGLFDKIKEVCDNRPTDLSDYPRIPERRMVQRFSVPDSVEEAENYDSDATVTYKNLDNRVLGYDDLSKMPAMNHTWWKESYAGGCQEFFKMEEVDGFIGHVQSGEYVKPTDDVYARGYDETCVVIADFLLSSHEKGEREKSRMKRKRRSN